MADDPLEGLGARHEAIWATSFPAPAVDRLGMLCTSKRFTDSAKSKQAPRCAPVFLRTWSEPTAHRSFDQRGPSLATGSFPVKTLSRLTIQQVVSACRPGANRLSPGSRAASGSIGIQSVGGRGRGGWLNHRGPGLLDLLRDSDVLGHVLPRGHSYVRDGT